MAGKQRYTVQEVIDALIACNGLIYLAAEKLGCTSDTVINYKNRHPSIRKAIMERRGRRVDVGEAALDKAVLNGEAWAVQFLLRTQAKDRGYVERQEFKNVSDDDINRAIEDELAQLAQEGPAAPAGESAAEEEPST